MSGVDILGWAVTFMWAGIAVWVFFDAKRSGRPRWSHAIATLVLPGLGLAVYLGLRPAADRETALSPNGQQLLRELTAEVERLRAENDELRAARRGDAR